VGADHGHSATAVATPLALGRPRRLCRVVRRALSLVTALLLALTGVVAAYVTLFTNHVYITTPSMYPTLPPGSIAIIEKAPTYKVGDVIEFRGNDLLFLHRIIRISSSGDITTKGDNPENAPDFFDPPTSKATVIGKEVIEIPWLGFPELFAYHPGYALAWLRGELGTKGRLEVVVACLLCFLVYGSLIDDKPKTDTPRVRA
jgi:signal peptidase I